MDDWMEKRVDKRMERHKDGRATQFLKQKDLIYRG